MATSRVPANVTDRASETFTPTPRQPRLIWTGKKRRREASAVPAQVLEIVRPTRSARAGADHATDPLFPGAEDAPQNRLIWTNDNLTALTSLLAGDEEHPPLEGQVDLIYIDPPFAVKNNFNINVEIEDGVADEKLPTLIEQLAYEDTWKDGLDSYLSMMRDRLELLKRLLKPTGSIYVHCDWHAGHYLKVLMDEVFGYESFRNSIIWAKNSLGAKGRAKQYPRNQDIILFYSKTEIYTFNKMMREQEEIIDVVNGKERLPTGYKVDAEGRYYWTSPKGDYTEDSIARMRAEGRIEDTSSGGVRIKYFVERRGNRLVKERLVDDVWDDIEMVFRSQDTNTGFPTQKPLGLLQRIVSVSSNPGDLVLDAFAGSGTTALAAEVIQDGG